MPDTESESVTRERPSRRRKQLRDRRDGSRTSSAPKRKFIIDTGYLLATVMLVGLALAGAYLARRARFRSQSVQGEERGEGALSAMTDSGPTPAVEQSPLVSRRPSLLSDGLSSGEVEHFQLETQGAPESPPLYAPLPVPGPASRSRSRMSRRRPEDSNSSTSDEGSGPPSNVRSRSPPTVKISASNRIGSASSSSSTGYPSPYNNISMSLFFLSGNGRVSGSSPSAEMRPHPGMIPFPPVTWETATSTLSIPATRFATLQTPEESLTGTPLPLKTPGVSPTTRLSFSDSETGGPSGAVTLLPTHPPLQTTPEIVPQSELSPAAPPPNTLRGMSMLSVVPTVLHSTPPDVASSSTPSPTTPERNIVVVQQSPSPSPEALPSARPPAASSGSSIPPVQHSSLPAADNLPRTLQSGLLDGGQDSMQLPLPQQETSPVASAPSVLGPEETLAWMEKALSTQLMQHPGQQLPISSAVPLAGPLVSQTGNDARSTGNTARGSSPDNSQTETSDPFSSLDPLGFLPSGAPLAPPQSQPEETSFHSTLADLYTSGSSSPPTNAPASSPPTNAPASSPSPRETLSHSSDLRRQVPTPRPSKLPIPAHLERSSVSDAPGSEKVPQDSNSEGQGGDQRRQASSIPVTRIPRARVNSSTRGPSPRTHRGSSLPGQLRTPEESHFE